MLRDGDCTITLNTDTKAAELMSEDVIVDIDPKRGIVDVNDKPGVHTTYKVRRSKGADNEGWDVCYDSYNPSFGVCYSLVTGPAR